MIILTADSVELWVPGEPVGKGRPRHGKGRVYTPSATVAAEARIVAEWAHRKAFTGPVSLLVVAYFARPASHTRKNRSLTPLGQRTPLPAKRPDIDNVVKLVADALNTHAYVDDAQIVSLQAMKRWAGPPLGPGVLITVCPTGEV